MNSQQKARQIAQEIRHRQNAEKIMECQNSGLSIAEWCRREEISTNTFYRWRRQAREMAVESMESKNALVVQGADSSAISTEPAHPRFVELQAPASKQITMQPPGRDTAIRIQIGETVVEIQKKTDIRLAESVVRALARLC